MFLKVRGGVMNIINRNLDFKNLDYRKKIDLIVLHHAAHSTCSVEDIHRWHLEKGWEGIGYHYFIDKKGLIFKGRPDNTIGAHCKGYNDASLGICMQGNFMVESMPEVQIKSLEWLLNKLCLQYAILVVKNHRDLKSTDCPGTNFPKLKLSEFIINDSSEKTYTVKKGDTLYSIALKYGISVSDLKNINGIKPDIIIPNQILKIHK